MSPAVMKYMGEEEIRNLTTVTMESIKVSKECKSRIILSIYKKENKTEYNHQGDKTLGNVLKNFFARMLQKRMRNKTVASIKDAQ